MLDINSAFDTPQTSTAKKRIFGLLKVYGTPVTLTSGEQYSIEGVLQQDFDTKQNTTRIFRGKKKVASGTPNSRVHIVMVLTRSTREGGSYQQMKDYLDNDKTWVKQVQPSFVKVFGLPLPQTLKVNTGEGLFVALDEAETTESFPGRNGEAINKTAWVAGVIYPNAEAMQKASDEHFAQFAGNGAGSDGNGLVDANETWNAIKTEKDYIESLRGGVASTKAKPLQVKKVKDTSLEWGLTEADYAAHAEEIMQLAGIAA